MGWVDKHTGKPGPGAWGSSENRPPGPPRQKRRGGGGVGLPPPRGGWPQAEKVPSRYNSDSEETFDVPPGGTDKADFPLVTTVKKPR